MRINAAIDQLQALMLDEHGPEVELTVMATNYDGYPEETRICALLGRIC